MKARKRWPRVAVIAALAYVAAGCTSTLSRVDDEGTTAQPVFPALGPGSAGQGSWPNRENLSKVRAGMDKRQLMDLIGPPHFREGLIDVREWDYLFHLEHAGQPQLCQYKILFDRTMRARSFHWLPQDCAHAAGSDSASVVDK